jgi:hypothetical protein
MKLFLAILAAVLSFTSDIPYIRDMVRRRTRPNVVSWFCWAVLAYIELAAMLVKHAYVPAILAIGGASGLSLVVLFGLKYGFARFNKFDITCLICAGMAGLFWWLFNSPLVGLFMGLAVDYIVALPTVYHSWHRFREETLSTYLISVAGGVAAFMALTSYRLVDFAYPFMVITIDGVIAFAIFRGRVRYHDVRVRAAKKAARTRRYNAKHKKFRRRFALASSR